MKSVLQRSSISHTPCMKIVSNNEMSEGMFGQVILFMCEVLPILELKNVDVNTLQWEVSTRNYGSIFPNVLEYTGQSTTNANTSVVPLNNLRNLRPQYVLGDNFIELNKLFFKYFRFPKELEEKSNLPNLSECLGLHFRGTDKTTDRNMNTPMTKTDFFTIIDSYIVANNIKHIFLATDEKEVYDYLQSKYSHIHVLSSRGFDGNLFWRGNKEADNAKYAIIDMLCLSKCNVVLKVSSALSSFSKLINPNLKIFRLNALKMFTDIPYFPDAYIPLLEKSDQYTSDCNATLDKIQQDDWSYKHRDRFNNFYYKVR